MRISIRLDQELAAEVERTVDLCGEKPATILRLAIRAGLPLVIRQFMAARPPGYFASDYPLPKNRRELEEAMSKSRGSSGVKRV
jgi:hypothetical protein